VFDWGGISSISIVNSILSVSTGSNPSPLVIS
jgi:hypothetical protein